MPDLPDLLDAIQADPNSEGRWLALSWWLSDNGRDDEAAAVRVFWPTLRDTVAAGTTVRETMRRVAGNAAKLSRRARRIEQASDGPA
jgi:uncharacterized protein (TIGR02996 family)